MLKQGIILLAYGHSYYGRYAYNLALSIKSVEDTNITLVYHGNVLSHLREDQKLIFDNLIEYENDPGFGVKMELNNFSPYDQTIFLDVDTVWFPRNKPSDLFELLKDYDFSGITEGYYDISTNTDNGNPKYYYWGDPQEIIRVHKPIANIYQWRTEFMYWKKGKVSDQLFKTARKVYEKPLLKSIKRFAHHVPDELALNIAAAKHDVHPHEYKWQPTYWPPMQGNIITGLDDLYKFYAFSCGSNRLSIASRQVYDRVMKAACYKMGVQYIFPPFAKNGFDFNRAKM